MPPSPASCTSTEMEPPLPSLKHSCPSRHPHQGPEAISIPFLRTHTTVIPLIFASLQSLALLGQLRSLLWSQSLRNEGDMGTDAQLKTLLPSGKTEKFQRRQESLEVHTCNPGTQEAEAGGSI